MIRTFKESGFDVAIINEKVKIVTEGVFFNVIIFDDIVIKIPKKDANNFKDPLVVEELVKVQNYLAAHMSEVSPAEVFNNFIITKKATGIRADFITGSKFEEEFKRRVNMFIQKINSLGVEIVDITKANIYIDGDKWQLIDFSGAKFKDNEV